MKKHFKIIVVGLSSLLLSSTVLSSATALADTSDKAVISSKEAVSKDGYRIFLVNGKMVKWLANMPAPTEEQITALQKERGKWGAAIKAIRKGYSKLPAGVKSSINKYLGLNAILGTLDHWTGWIEDGIYYACRKSGMPDWMARTVAKALTLIAL